ncbi:helix-turn-helix transcriptional regulator [Ruegeria profundi]|uniref:Transcriptional regulator n=1 Tax=Ruegeria profundi TaxID=1685378 RepID=A0A0X3TMZ4_9RHOB|nr:AlpA family phage regulatory protein [Ruegeria profundi]KUJ77083.1 transcriptional regulator [Ruegeria profundi]
MSAIVSTHVKYLTLNELRKKLGNRSRSSIYADLAAERLPKPFKLGGRLLWIEEEIDLHLRALRDGEIC